MRKIVLSKFQLVIKSDTKFTHCLVAQNLSLDKLNDLAVLQTVCCFLMTVYQVQGTYAALVVVGKGRRVDMSDSSFDLGKGLLMVGPKNIECGGIRLESVKDSTVFLFLQLAVDY
jgi:hypothetical protein